MSANAHNRGPWHLSSTNEVCRPRGLAFLLASWVAIGCSTTPVVRDEARSGPASTASAPHASSNAVASPSATGASPRVPRKSLTAGGELACARLSDSWACWNDSELVHGAGAVSLAERYDSARLGEPPQLPEWEAVATGDDFLCALSEAGSVYCAGNGAKGSLGDGTRRDHTFPTLVPGLAGITRIAAADEQVCAIDSTGNVHCWGCLFDCKDFAPAKIDNVAHAVDLAVGDGRACAILSDGSLHCWLRDRDHPPAAATSRFCDVPTLPPVAEVFVGPNFTCARTKDQRVLCWGMTGEGQLGDGEPAAEGDGEYRPDAQPVKGLTNVAQLGGFWRTPCARLVNGTVWCWREHQFVGATGIVTRRANGIPEALPGISDAVDLAGGLEQSCLRRRDQSVWCWGRHADKPLRVH